MKAVVFKGIGTIALENVAEPTIKDPKDVIVKLTRSAICGTDLHMIRGTIPNMVGRSLFNKGTILGHEGVGIIEKVGSDIKNFAVGDRVIVPSTVCCGHCEYCEQELYAQCDNANPYGPNFGTVFYGGPANTGPLNGMQAEKVRVPLADSSLVKIPDDISDDQAILLSDIAPTAYMAAEFVDPQSSDTVAVFGCGPVGQLTIAWLKYFGVQTIFAVDCVEERLKMAENQGAIPINFDTTDPVKKLKELTNKKGPTKVIDAVGIDANGPHCSGLACLKNYFTRREFKKERKKIAPYTNPHNGNWIPGDGPSQVLRWAVEAVAKCGTISIIGVYTPAAMVFPIGTAMNKNLTIKMGNCNHKAYIPTILELIQTWQFDPTLFISHRISLEDAIDAYKHFDKREDSWIKVVLIP